MFPTTFSIFTKVINLSTLSSTAHKNDILGMKPDLKMHFLKIEQLCFENL